MIDWLYGRRDSAAAGASLLVLAAGLAAWRWVPTHVAPLASDHETVVRLEDRPPEPPPPAPPAPAAAPVTPSAPAQVPRPAPQLAPTPAPAPVQQEAPAPVAAPVVAPAPPAPAAPPPAPQPSPAPPPPRTLSAQNADDAYRAAIRRYLNEMKRYPTSREARQLRPQGVVRVWFELDRAGQLLGLGIDAPSGSPLLDREALRTVRNGHYPPVPADAFVGASSLRLVVPIEYLLEQS